MFFGCRICKRTDGQHYCFSHAGEDFFLCEACGTGYLSPGLSGSRLDAFYKSDYRRTYLYEVMGYSRALFYASRNDLEAAHVRLADVEPALLHGASVWEIGSGLGAFAALLGRMRPDVEIVATEPDEAARLSFDPPGHVRFESFEAASAGRYDLIVAFHVLEHVVDPADFLLTCRTALKPDGRLFIEVPDYEVDLSDRAFAHPAHLSYFTASALAGLAAASGFDVLDCTKTSRDARGHSISLTGRPGEITWRPGAAVANGSLAADIARLRAVRVSRRAQWRSRFKRLCVGLFGPRLTADGLRCLRLLRRRLQP